MKRIIILAFLLMFSTASFADTYLACRNEMNGSTSNIVVHSNEPVATRNGSTYVKTATRYNPDSTVLEFGTYETKLLLVGKKTDNSFFYAYFEKNKYEDSGFCLATMD